MQDTGSLLALLVTVTAISLTGVIAPGPVTAVTISKGMSRKGAGALVAAGHGMVEMPMIALIWLGFATVLAAPGVKMAVGVAGGVVLIWMGVGMLRTRPQAYDARREVASGCVLAGLSTTLANPYWLVWWATVGAALVASASAWGVWGVVAFAVAHWLCDLGWLSIVSWGVFSSRRFWTPTVHRTLLLMCGVVLLGFGVYFIVSGAGSLSW
jgi:threonine/homoserine/homoserine lactone efflux protein